MRIDPAQGIEAEIANLKKQITDLKRTCDKYFRTIDEIRSRRSGWKQNRPTNKYGDRF
jgi:uncharacterized coiled-coil DUF342 family protein